LLRVPSRASALEAWYGCQRDSSADPGDADAARRGAARGARGVQSVAPAHPRGAGAAVRGPVDRAGRRPDRAGREPDPRLVEGLEAARSGF